MTTIEEFWNEIDGTLRHSAKHVDERGRLTRAGADWKFTQLATFTRVFRGRQDAFETEWNRLALAAATDKVAAAKAKVAGFSTKARKLADAYGALDNSLRKLAACDDAFAPYRDLLRSVGLGSLAADLVPAAGKFRELASKGEGHVRDWSRRKDYFLAQLVARQDEVAGWPTPSLDDLSTLYCTEDNVPTRVGSEIHNTAAGPALGLAVGF